MRIAVVKLSFILIFLGSLFAFGTTLQETNARKRSLELGKATCQYMGKDLQISVGDASDKQKGELDILIKESLWQADEGTIDNKDAGYVRFETYSGEDRKKYTTPDAKSIIKPSECSFSITRRTEDIGKPAPASLTLTLKCKDLTLKNFDPLKPADLKYIDTRSFEIVAGEKGDGHILCTQIN